VHHRSGVFPFFKIPEELRRWILCFVIDDIRQFDEKEGWWSVYVGLGYRPESNKKLIHPAAHITNRMSNEKSATIRHLLACQNHPARSSRYIYLFQRRRMLPSDSLTQRNWALPQLDWLREASHVNTSSGQNSHKRSGLEANLMHIKTITFRLWKAFFKMPQQRLRE
jgi:hypothetical protein